MGTRDLASAVLKRAVTDYRKAAQCGNRNNFAKGAIRKWFREGDSVLLYLEITDCGRGYFMAMLDQIEEDRKAEREAAGIQRGRR